MLLYVIKLLFKVIPVLYNNKLDIIMTIYFVIYKLKFNINVENRNMHRKN